MTDKATKAAVILICAGLLGSSCQPLTREKPEWFITETYQEAIAEYQNVSVEVVRLDDGDKETGERAEIALARPNLARIVTYRANRMTGMLASDGRTASWSNSQASSSSPAPPDLNALDLARLEETGRWGTRLLTSTELITELKNTESTSERLDGSEVVRLTGEERSDSGGTVKVAVWISPDSGLPLRYRRQEGGRSLALAFRKPALDAELDAGHFAAEAR